MAETHEANFEVKCSKCGKDCRYRFYVTNMPFDWGKDIRCPDCWAGGSKRPSKLRIYRSWQVTGGYPDVEDFTGRTVRLTERHCLKGIISRKEACRNSSVS